MRSSIPVVAALASVVGAQTSIISLSFKRCDNSVELKLDVYPGIINDIGTALGGTACSATLVSVSSDFDINTVSCMTYADANDGGTYLFSQRQDAKPGVPLVSDSFKGIECSAYSK